MAEEFEEYRLFSSGKNNFNLKNHILKLSSLKFTLDNLTKPLTLTRPQRERKEFTGDPKRQVKKKSKQYFLGRDATDLVIDGGDGGVGSMVASIGSRLNDPDKIPWQLEDGDGVTFQGMLVPKFLGKHSINYCSGSLEGAQSSNYVLFVSGSEGFKVLPVSKFYKFNQNTTYKTLTLEEAEERMKSQKKQNDRWLMKGEGDGKGRDDGKQTKAKDWKEKLMGTRQNEYQHRVYFRYSAICLTLGNPLFYP